MTFVAASESTSPLLESVRVLAWMVLPVAAGYAAWRVWLRPLPEGARTAKALSRALSRTALIGSATPLMIFVFWGAPLPAGRAMALPFLGLSVHVLGLLAGWFAARRFGMGPSLQGALLLSSTSSNVLTFGGITVLLLLRSVSDPNAERALGEMAVYRVFEAPFYFLVAWPVAASVTGAGEVRWQDAFRRAFRSLTLVPMAGILVGAALNVSGLPRPGALDGVAGIFVKINVVLLGLTVGFTLRGAAPRRHFAKCLLVAAIKFGLMPLFAVGAAWALGFPGSTLQVVAICASMPVAFMAVVGATVFDLDEELVSTCWLFTSVSMVVVVPVLAWVLPILASV